MQREAVTALGILDIRDDELRAVEVHGCQQHAELLLRSPTWRQRATGLLTCELKFGSDVWESAVDGRLQASQSTMTCANPRAPKVQTGFQLCWNSD